jgi:hypothetical protein
MSTGPTCSQLPHSPIPSTHTPPKRLLVYCADTELNTALDKWADKNGFHIIYSDADSPDIIAIWCMAAICDRRFMGVDMWNLYRQWVAEIDGNVLEYQGERIVSTVDEQVIIIDDLDLPLPQMTNHQCIQIVESGDDRIHRVISALDSTSLNCGGHRQAPELSPAHGFGEEAS